jgi:flagellar basal body P-ring formation protein FlgA
MKKIFSIVLITILALGSLKANAACLSGNEVKAIITKQVLERYKTYTDAELKIEVVALPFKDLSLPNGAVTFKVTSNSTKFMPRDLEKVSVYVNDKFVRTFNAPITVKAYQSVLVASTSINRERELSPEIVRVERREVSNILGNALGTKDLSKEIITKKFFTEGELIDKRFVKLRPEILRNSNVTVIFNSNNLTITIEAVALSDGSTGDSICIMNRNYNKVYKGTVIGENKVLVKI